MSDLFRSNKVVTKAAFEAYKLHRAERHTWLPINLKYRCFTNMQVTNAEGGRIRDLLTWGGRT